MAYLMNIWKVPILLWYFGSFQKWQNARKLMASGRHLAAIEILKYLSLPFHLQQILDLHLGNFFYKIGRMDEACVQYAKVIAVQKTKVAKSNAKNDDHLYLLRYAEFFTYVSHFPSIRTPKVDVLKLFDELSALKVEGRLRAKHLPLPKRDEVMVKWNKVQKLPVEL